MGQHISTVIIDPRSLVREALASLLETNAYRVVCSAGSAAAIEQGAFREMQPELVVIRPQGIADELRSQRRAPDADLLPTQPLHRRLPDLRQGQARCPGG